MTVLVKKQEAVFHERPGVKGWYYQLPDVDGGRSVIYAEVDGEHGERTIGDIPRTYFVIDGDGEFTVNGEVIPVTAGDTVIIPSGGTYNFHSGMNPLKIVLFMDLLDLSNLPGKK